MHSLVIWPLSQGELNRTTEDFIECLLPQSSDLTVAEVVHHDLEVRTTGEQPGRVRAVQVVESDVAPEPGP